MIPSILERIPSQIRRTGKTAAIDVKIKEVLIVLLFAGMPFLENSAARAIARVTLITLPPITSPKDNSGILCKAEDIPTKRLGNEPIKAIKRKETTNSFHPKNLATRLKLLTIISPEK